MTYEELLKKHGSEVSMSIPAAMKEDDDPEVTHGILSVGKDGNRPAFWICYDGGTPAHDEAPDMQGKEHARWFAADEQAAIDWAFNVFQIKL
jgi:hypothetical protein